MAELEAEGESAAERVAYLTPHADHTDTSAGCPGAARSAAGWWRGRAGPVVDRRLKQTGARWRVRRVEWTASLCCVLDSKQ